ncbi:MAG: hypothetical protein QM698_03555 [Micropepsaceae bacterium]
MRKSTLLLCACAVPASIAAVGPRIGELRGSLAVEAAWQSGDLAGAAISDIADLNLLGPDYAGEPGQLDIRGASFEDAFEQPGYGVKAELSYGLTNDIEVFGSVGWSQASGRAVVIGDVIPSSTLERLPLTATFGDLNTISLEAGARYYIWQDFIRPFVGASVGADFVDQVNVALSAPDAGILIEELRFIQSSTIFSAGVEAGVAFGDGVNVSGSLSIGARYLSALDGDATDLDSYGIGAITEGESRIVYPVKGSLSLRF